MSKDGSFRGGARVGSGRKPQPLADKLREGKEAEAIVLPEPPALEGVQMPDIKEYLSAEQRMGELKGREIYIEVYKWLCDRHCEQIVSPQLLEQFSLTMARARQLEEITSEYGFISKHPTTGAAISSPFVTMAQNYMKQANFLWQQIFQIVKENCTEPVSGNVQKDLMSSLLGI